MSLGRIKGSMVRLEPRDGVPLLLGEGVETASVEAPGFPAWATFGTSGLNAGNLPENIKDVIPGPRQIRGRKIVPVRVAIPRRLQGPQLHGDEVAADSGRGFRCRAQDD
jgi:hypothetical protein